MSDLDALSCSVCYHRFDSGQHKPWDLGCGHTFCQSCLRQSPSTFRKCPECRARAVNPHVSITLLRLLDTGSTGATTASSSGTATSGSSPPRQPAPPSTPQQPRQQQTQQQLLQRHPGASQTRIPPGPGVAGRMAGLAIPGPGMVNPGEAPISLAHHQAKLNEIRTSLWSWVSPLMGVLYILSPLDLIPDILPIIGWIDDLLVLAYVVYAVCGVLSRRV